MPSSESLTTRRLELERAHDQRQILAESALQGERAISLLRILTWLLLGIAFSGAEGSDPVARANVHTSEGIAHQAMIIGWILFAVAVWFVLRRLDVAHFGPRRALVWPIVFMLIDFGVFTTLGVTTAEPARPEVTIATLAILEAFNVARFSSLHVWLGALFASVGYVLQAAFGQHPFFDWRASVVAVACYACLGAVVWWANRRVRRMFVDVRRRENLARLLPRQVVDRILGAGGRPLEPVQREVTILFSDIRDFTSISERMEPRALLAMLDDYFARMSEIVKAHEGMVNKFIGDGMLALWGAPDPTEDHAERALKAALDMRRVVDGINQTREREKLPPLRIGIGVHTGTVAAGMLGGPDQHEYTVIGDAVNLASRIEGLTKRFDTDVLASEAAWRRAGAKFSGERAGEEAVKGREERVVVYRVNGASRP